MKNKVKSGLLILNLVFLFSCGKSQITNVSTYIFTADKIISDSLVPVGFCQVILFLESGEIKDTISDMMEYTFIKKKLGELFLELPIVILILKQKKNY